MGFHINKKVADKKAATGTKTTFQGGSSQFIAKANTKSTGTTKKPIKMVPAVSHTSLAYRQR